jgi:putative membrane protein
MIKKTGMAGLFLLGFMVPALAQMLSEQSQDFVTKAALGNQFEIRSSEIALDKAYSPNVKDFAQMMIKDHSQAGENLKSVLETIKSNM